MSAALQGGQGFLEYMLCLYLQGRALSQPRATWLYSQVPPGYQWMVEVSHRALIAEAKRLGLYERHSEADYQDDQAIALPDRPTRVGKMEYLLTVWFKGAPPSYYYAQTLHGDHGMVETAAGAIVAEAKRRGIYRATRLGDYQKESGIWIK